MENREETVPVQQRKKAYKTTIIPLSSEPPRQINSEDVKKLIRINPAIFSLFFGFGSHAFLNQFLKLWPSIKPEYLPYITTPSSLALALVGCKIGTDFVRNPLQDIGSHAEKRIPIAWLEATGVIFPGVLETAIKFYWETQPQSGRVPENLFAAEILPVPVALALYYGIWYSISPTQRTLWCVPSRLNNPSELTKNLTYITDVITKTLLYSRILQGLMANIQPTTSWVYEYIAIPAAFLVLVGQALKHEDWWQKVETFMLYGICVNLAFYMGKFLEEESQSPELWSFYLKASAFPPLLIAGTIFTTIQYFLLSAKAGSVPLPLSVVPNKKTWASASVVALSKELSDPVKCAQILSLLLDNPNIRKQLEKALLTDVNVQQENSQTTSPSLQTPQNINENQEHSTLTETLNKMNDDLQTLNLEQMQEDSRYKAITEHLLALLGLEIQPPTPITPTATPLLLQPMPLLFQQQLGNNNYGSNTTSNSSDVPGFTPSYQFAQQSNYTANNQTQQQGHPLL